jgi:hypothetical protein
MRQQALFSSIVVLHVSVLLQLPAIAEVSPQNTWQQPYNPTRLQWLFINLHGGGERTPCGVSDLDGKPRAWYEWQRPHTEDKQLSLAVFTRSPEKNSIPDRDFCLTTALGNLKLEAFRMENSPPPVELRHFQMNQNGQSLKGTYQCLVPAAKTAVDLNIDRFENICR